MTGVPAAPVGVLLSGIGGYGYYYLRTLLDEVAPERARLVGVVDPEARLSRAWQEVERLGVPVCATAEEFYAGGRTADLAVIVSPIQHHVPQCSVALEHGSCVLCDKPLGATVQEARALAAASRRADRWVMVGYQWSYSAAIRALKRDILSGSFGRPVRFSTICCWPRDRAYYERNRWAGRLRDPESGRWVLDGPANNAMAHFLHNLLYLGGGATGASATPRRVRAELYRAYPIESCDTAACRVVADGGLEILFFASHVTETAIEPSFRLEFERGSATLGGRTRTIVAHDAGGRARDYGAPDETPQFQKLFDAIDAVRHTAPVACGVEAASSQTLAVNGMHESVPDAVAFPSALVGRDPAAIRLFVPGLAATLARCYEEGRLPSESGVDWAVAGPEVDVDGYAVFPARVS
jgi:predicted dehydrogenase